jgi:hypothetical protein
MPRIAEVSPRSRASGRELTEAFRDARIFLEHVFELGPGNGEAPHVGLCAHTGRAFDVLTEERSFAEDVAGSQLAVTFGRLDHRVSLFEHEES